jgi:hypothetical protein
MVLVANLYRHKYSFEALASFQELSLFKIVIKINFVDMSCLLFDIRIRLILII